MPGIDINTKFMWHMDNLSEQFINDALLGNIFGVTAFLASNAGISSNKGKFAANSLLLTASTSDRVTVNLFGANLSVMQVGSGYTIDFWANFNTLPSSGNSMYLSSQSNTGILRFYIKNTAGAYSMKFGIEANSDIDGGAITLDTGNWHHFAFVYDPIAGQKYLFFDGVTAGAIANTDEMLQNNGSFTIGASSAGSFGSFLDAYISEFRISKGIPRWTSNFTPSASPYDSIGSTTPPGIF